jgi:hypothetical protein
MKRPVLRGTSIPFIEGISKTPGHTTKMSSLHQSTNENSYRHIFGNEWFWNLIGRLYSAINT